MNIVRYICAAPLIVATTLIATTQTFASDENPDPVYVFNRICYAQVPNLDSIQEMALKLAWRSMPPEDLKQFRSFDNPSVLKGWDAQVGERLFRVGITQAGLTEKMKNTFPDLAQGTVTSCSIVLDDQQDASTFMANMQSLVGKQPVSTDVPEGLLRTTTWAGGSDTLKVFVFAKAPPTDKGGMLNVTILQK